MHGRGFADLPCDDAFAVVTDVKRDDIVSVEFRLVSLVLGLHRYFLASVEALLKSFCVHDNAECRDHKDSFSICVVPQILLAVTGSVSVDVFRFEFHFGLLRVSLCKFYCSHLLVSSGIADRSKSN